MKILINDDSELVTRQIELTLERNFDHEIIVSNDSSSALGEFRLNDSIDLVITDLMMPQMNGVKFAEEITKMSQNNDSGQQSPPDMILITAVDKNSRRGSFDNTLLELAINSGYFEEVLHKPINREKLLRCISRISFNRDQSVENRTKYCKNFESICSQIDQAVLDWDILELVAFKDFLESHINNITELQSKQ